MPTGKQIFSSGSKGLKQLCYDHFIYHFPEQAFFDKAYEMEEAIGVPLLGFLRDELYNYGILEENDRGDWRIGPKMRKRMKEYLVNHPMPLPPKPTKKSAMKLRQELGLEQLVKTGRELGFDILSYTDEGSMIWSRKLGVLAVAGSSWCYVYKTGHSFRMDINFPILGYFQLGGSDIPGQLRKAINGELQAGADKLSERRRAFMIRKKRGQDKINFKRSKSQELLRKDSLPNS